jgi:hypothetical protein
MLVAGRYLLAEAVGQGGMGRVWRGHDQLLDRVVAVKEVILPPQSPGAHAELLARTMREARAAARLDHPSVITIHDVVEHGGSPWIVMQFVSGWSLRVQMDRDGHLPWQQIADIGQQVADALAAAHAAGIVHRDLKPDNILLSGRRAIVTDFGIARIIDATTQLTGTGVLVGTPLYMAPEHLDSGTVGPAADMWSLGATLYTALEGTPPFSGPTMTALMAAILTRAPARPRHAGPLLEVLAALLSKDPAQRPNAQAVARMLAAYRSGQAVSDSTASVPIAAVAQRDPRGTRFRDTLAGDWLQTEGSREAPATVSTSTPLPGVTGHPSFPGVRWTPTTQPEMAGQPQPLARLALPARRRRWSRPAVILSAAALLAALVSAGAALLPIRAGEHGKTSADGRNTAPSPSTKKPTARSSMPITASITATLTDRNGQVESIAFEPDDTLVVADANGNTYLWNTATKSVITTLPDPQGEGPMTIASGPNGTLAVVDTNNNTYIWNTSTRSLITTLAEPDGGVPESVAFGPDDTLAIGDANGNTYLWNTDTWSLITTLTDPDLHSATSVAFGPDGILAVGDDSNADENRNTYLWNINTKSLITLLPDPGGTGVQRLAFGPDDTLAVADTNGNTYLWNTATKSLITTLASVGGRPLSVAFGPDSTLAVGQANGKTLLWSTVTRRIAATLTDPDGKIVDSVAFGPDGTLAVGDFTGHTYLWRIATGKS